MLQFVAELLDEVGVRAVALVGVAQFIERLGQGLGNEGSAVGAEVALRVGQVIHLHF